MSDPQVSVVMGVHNGGDALEATLDSVLSQRDVDLELIVVDDGSSDGTARLLKSRADRDERLRILVQPRNMGLTEALIRGCDAARGEFIARQDCGDRSLPGRFRAQWDFLRLHPEVIGVECGTLYCSPCGLPLYEIARSNGAWQHGLEILDVNRIAGPSHHGATCFRKASYCEVGGYRAHFRVAQDLDLWLRLAEVGKLASMPQVLYQAEVSVAGISTEKRPLQFAFAHQAIQAAERRRRGQSDDDMLRSAPPSARQDQRDRSAVEAGFNYFVGSALLAKGCKGPARDYLRRSISLKPLVPKTWIRLLQTLL